jgi:hypothetical protein
MLDICGLMILVSKLLYSGAKVNLKHQRSLSRLLVALPPVNWTDFSNSWPKMLTHSDASVRIFDMVSILIPDACGQGVRTGVIFLKFD